MPSFASLLLSPCVFPLEDISGQDGTTMTRTLPGNIFLLSLEKSILLLRSDNLPRQLEQTRRFGRPQVGCKNLAH